MHHEKPTCRHVPPRRRLRFSNDVLTIKDGTKTEATLNFFGSYTQSDFMVVTAAAETTITLM